VESHHIEAPWAHGGFGYVAERDCRHRKVLHR
jgi:hypothetical protein